MDNPGPQSVDAVTATPESSTCDTWAAISMANQQEAPYVVASLFGDIGNDAR
jgi:hypothetical protein